MKLKPKEKNPFFIPLASAPTKQKPLSKEELEKQKYIEFMKKLLGRVVDCDGMSEREITALATFYNDISHSEEHAPISAKRVKNFIENVIKNDNIAMYKKIIAFYEFIEDDSRTDKKRKKEALLLLNYYDTIRTLDNAMLYSIAVEESVNRIASKLDAPDDMTPIEKAKWLRLWFILLRNHEYFFTDFDSNNRLVHPTVIAKLSEQYICPESIVLLEKRHFSLLDDRTIVFSLIRDFISLFPQSVQSEVYRFAELDGAKHTRAWKMADIRQKIKKQLFPNSMRSGIFTFMTIPGIKEFNPESLELALKAYKNGGISTLPKYNTIINDVFNNLRARTLTCFELGEIELDNGQKTKITVSSEEELMLYVNLYNWLLEHPNFKFGKENKTIAEYGLDTIFFSAKNTISIWVLNNGFANSEDDINYECIDAVLSSASFTTLLKNYSQGKIGESELLNHCGFKNTSMAKMICSYSGLELFNDTEIKQALKRVKMFGFDNSLPNDKLYAKLFLFLIKSNLPCGKAKKPVSSYRIPYTEKDFKI